MIDVLVADDTDEIRNIIQMTLETKGYRVRTVTDGAKVLEEMQRRQPDILITDINMPNMDGYALIEELRTRPEWKTIPVIVISGLTRDSRRSEETWAERLEVDVFLTKPFDPIRLIESIERLTKQ